MNAAAPARLDLSAFAGTPIAVLGLGVLAMFSGGATLPAAFATFGAIAANAALAFEHYQQTAVLDAAANSDLDAAKAIAGDPGWEWLAVEILFVGVDVVGASDLFLALRPLAREALLAAKLERATAVEAGEQLSRSRHALDEIVAIGDAEADGLGTAIANRITARAPALADELLEAGATGKGLDEILDTALSHASRLDPEVIVSEAAYRAQLIKALPADLAKEVGPKIKVVVLDGDAFEAMAKSEEQATGGEQPKAA